jgi:hypothetical protein
MTLRLFGLLAAALLFSDASATAAEPEKRLVSKVFSVADLVTPIPDFTCSMSKLCPSAAPDASPV